MSRTRAASIGLNGPAAANRMATRCPASAASVTSPGCSNTRVEPSAARWRVRAGSTLDTQPHYRQPPPGQHDNNDAQAGQTEQCAARERARIKEDLDVVISGGQRNGAEQHVHAQYRWVDARH